MTSSSPNLPLLEKNTEPSAAEDGSSLLERARQGDDEAFETLIRRYNRRLFRVARSVVQDASEAEDVVQQAYVSAYVKADQFAGRASLSTWLTRITFNEALGRVRRRNKNIADVSAAHDWRSGNGGNPNPEECASRRELAALLEAGIDRLPENYRVVFVLRELEELDGHEVAQALGITLESVRVRLHRARVMLRKHLFVSVGSYADEVFAFGGERCDRIVRAVADRTRPSVSPPRAFAEAAKMDRCPL